MPQCSVGLQLGRRCRPGFRLVSIMRVDPRASMVGCAVYVNQEVAGWATCNRGNLDTGFSQGGEDFGQGQFFTAVGAV